MKVSISIVSSLVVATAVARPRATGQGDSEPEKSRVTAFVVSDDGSPSVECWEISDMINDQQTKRKDGSEGPTHVVQIAGSRDLEGVDILTWPSYADIWPPSSDFQTEDFGPSSLFALQGGLVNFILKGHLLDSDDETSQWVFSQENGDDWFYYEDPYSDSSLARSRDAAPPPFQISTISGSETEVLRFRFPKQPKHKVLHKGACSFSGISVPKKSSRGSLSAFSHGSNLLVQ